MFFFGLICMLMLYISEAKELVGPKHVTGIVKGELSVKFQYSTLIKANKHLRKYVCQYLGHSCNTIVSTNNFVMDNFKNRVSIEDYPEEGFFIFKLSDLRLEDEGTYGGGIGDINGRKISVVNVEVTEESSISRDAEVLFGSLRSTLIFNCEFDGNFTKYLCKLGKHGCDKIIDEKGFIAPSYEGRVLITIVRQPGSFTVKLIQLRKDDRGFYTCGVGEYGGDGESKDFDVNINEETDIAMGSRVLPSNVGGSISALCPYNPKKTYTSKFWCKWEGQSCNPIIKTDGFVKDSFEGKVLIHDNPVNGTMQVLMNGLTKEDEGWYWCVMTNDNIDQTSTVQVKISEGKTDGLSGTKTVYVSAGKPASISCSYPCMYRSYKKYWCKWGNNGCEHVASEDSDQSGLSLSCDVKELKLNFDSVTKEDGGWYWCGVKKNGKYGETLTVHLIVGEKENEVEGINTDISGSENNDNVPENRKIVINSPTPSPGDTKTSNVLAICLSLGAIILLVSAALLIIKLRKRKDSDLVSVASYRTNISMTEMETGPNIGKDNPAVVGSQETVISSSQDGKKTNKKGSKEDLAYSSFLIYSDGKPNDDATL